MVTTIPLVTVSAAERGQFVVGCDRCPQYRTVRPARPLADAAAVEHEASHGRMDPADQINELEGWQP